MQEIKLSNYIQKTHTNRKEQEEENEKTKKTTEKIEKKFL